MRKLERGVWEFDEPVYVNSFASVVGKKEGEGPLGKHFDRVYSDSKMNEDSWEKAESRLQEEACLLAIEKGGLLPGDIDTVFSGDLLNQCIASTFGLKNIGAPFMGLFGACSTMAEALLTACVFTASGCADNCIAVTSSHFCTAERQFRTPLEYGGQRTPTAQWTVTGSGAVMVSSKRRSPVRVTAACVGRINDYAVNDPSNMGAAMAPAACDTIERFMASTGKSMTDFDVVMTGDLGFVGHELLVKLLERDRIDCQGRLTDGGMLIFDRKKQDVHAGGSGCGCCASVLCGYFLPKLMSGEIKNMLFVATGALMSTTSFFQGETIPAVAHAVELKSMAEA